MSKIGIIGAMELEVEELKEKMEVSQRVQKASMEFLEGLLNGAEVVIVKCGVGKVNAALCTQILCDLFEVTHIINTGIAGSLKNEINIGDIVVSKDALYHDMDARAFGYGIGEIPQMGCLSFLADEEMAQLAVSCCKEVNPDISVYEGRIASGDQFIADKGIKDKIIENFGAYCVEMEGASIAHAAYLNNIPFVIIRAISDKADDSAQMDYPEFEKAAAIHSATLVERMLAQM